MTIKQAIDRMIWRFSPDERGVVRRINPAPLDTEAVNAIVDFYNSTTENAVANNEGFVKLYIWAFAQLCKHFDTTPMNDIPQKELHRLLDKPISYFIMKLTKSLNEKEQDDMIVEAGIADMQSVFATPEQTKERAAKIMKIINQEGNADRFTGRAWEEETVADNILAQAALAIVKFNKP